MIGQVVIHRNWVEKYTDVHAVNLLCVSHSNRGNTVNHTLQLKRTVHKSHFGIKYWYNKLPVKPVGQIKVVGQLRVSDASDWIEFHVITGDFPEVPVLPWPQIKHPALIICLFKHQPVAVLHVAGLHARHVIFILDGVAVIGQFVHLAFKVWSLVDPHLKGSFVLLK